MLRFKNLGSGSTGNSTVVEGRSGVQVHRLLVDCGFGIRQLQSRLAQAQLQIEDLDAVFITHEHSDHIGCAQAVALRYGIPVWMSQGTYDAIGQPDFGGMLRVARDLEPIDLGAFEARPFTVPHDAREPLQLRCSDGARTLGVLTDLGHATAHVLARLSGVHALLLEFNHDSELLANSAYPAFLKLRVGGRHGHLSNAAAAEIARAVRHEGLRHVVAAHLSEQNNRPEIVRRLMAEALGGHEAEMLTASASEGSPWLDV